VRRNPLHPGRSAAAVAAAGRPARAGGLRLDRPRLRRAPIVNKLLRARRIRTGLRSEGVTRVREEYATRVAQLPTAERGGQQRPPNTSRYSPVRYRDSDPRCQVSARELSLSISTITSGGSSPSCNAVSTFRAYSLSSSIMRERIMCTGLLCDGTSGSAGTPSIAGRNVYPTCRFRLDVNACCLHRIDERTQEFDRVRIERRIRFCISRVVARYGRRPGRRGREVRVAGEIDSPENHARVVVGVRRETGPDSVEMTVADKDAIARRDWLVEITEIRSAQTPGPERQGTDRTQGLQAAAARVTPPDRSNM
jgi:hypothetical protein